MYLYYDATSEFDRLFQDALTARCQCPRAVLQHALPPEAKHATSRQRNVYHPRLDLHESTDTNTVTATFELPGFTSESVAIDVQQNRLTVSGESTAPDSEEQRNYLVRERRSAGKFSRTLQLPFGTKPEDVKAKMENGILTITFPRTSPEQEAKRVLIQ